MTGDASTAEVPASAIEAGIVLNESIGGIAIGMSRDEITARIGQPMKAEYNDALKKKVWTYRGLSMWLGRKSADNDWHVTRIDTQSGKIRTKDGFGVGSYAARFEAAYPNATCENDDDWQGCWMPVAHGSTDTETTFEHGDDGKFYSATMEEGVKVD